MLVTCNFHLTLRRLVGALKGIDAWIIVADSKGINVWCAAGARELDTDSVVSAVKTCGVADKVDHRTLILPPLAGPGVRAVDVAERTGWKVRWGPVRATDIRKYLDAGMKRDEAMKRATSTWLERVDAGVGSMFSFYALVAIPVAIFAPGLIVHYLVVTLATLIAFLLLSPWIPGRSGIAKALLLQLPLGALLVLVGRWAPETDLPLRADLIIVMGTLLGSAVDLGGMSAVLPSSFDPFMARLGVRKFAGIAFAGTTRTDLLLGARRLVCDAETCISCRRCVEICPLGVWTMGSSKTAEPEHVDRCTACQACLVQCPSGAISAEPTSAAGS